MRGATCTANADEQTTTRQDGGAETVTRGCGRSAKFSEYVSSAHSTETIAIIAKLCIMVPRMFFLRTRPP